MVPPPDYSPTPTFFCTLFPHPPVSRRTIGQSSPPRGPQRTIAEGTVRSYTLATLSVPQPCGSLGGTQVTEVSRVMPAAAVTRKPDASH